MSTTVPTPPLDLTPAARALGGLVTTVTDDDLAAPTPCTGWTVADLLDHLDVVAAGFTALARGTDDPAPGPGDVPWDGGRRDTLATGLARMAGAWRSPAAGEGTAGAPGPVLPRATWGRIGLTELVVHAWDLARALDRPVPDLPADVLRATADHVAVFVPRAPLPELWGPRVPTGDDAPLWDRVVAGTGRTP
ncbi:TIGR03086 family metal-binding protein [Actinomycetospora straminea]|uniref:TIGR03086 family metal-binding protein n=1 Tax=Actinomycetospora straminea TaxID=663607 RepID=UPI0023667B9B|nr:TIGR03086 family metal-binding protein [Actinomycetospora straminea]MDD7932251.1 TIGR03086 family metal-binding protein [Actinomycetospora straminea]